MFNNNTRFKEADQLLEKRAPDFYGIGAMPSRITDRFRTFQKALLVIPELDTATHKWLTDFNAERSSQLATKLLHSGIVVPRITVLIEEGEEEAATVQKSSAEEIPLSVAFRLHKEAVLQELARQRDPAAHIVNTLDLWRVNVGGARVSDIETSSAERCFEQFLFGVHGQILAEHVQTVAISESNARTS